MRRDIEYMTHLLEELSSFNNSEKLHLTDTAMTSFLRTLALSFAASLIDTPIEFISRIDPELPVLSIDTVKFRQLLLNLLSNARDALSAPGTSSVILHTYFFSRSTAVVSTPYRERQWVRHRS